MRPLDNLTPLQQAALIARANEALPLKESVKTNLDTTAITFVLLAESGNMDEITMGEHIDLFLTWESSIAYKANNIRQYNGKLYKCLQQHTSQEGWEPDTAPSLWKVVDDPTKEFPDWSQPIGAGDGYMKGDKVAHNEKHWVSVFEGENIWEPGVYGWEIISEV